MYVAQLIFDFYYYFFNIYTVSIFSFYIIILFISLNGIQYYFKKKSFTNYVSALSSPFSPSVSILIPMYNEQDNAITSVRSLLSNQYANYDIIVINDGSKDNTLERLIESFSLVEHSIDYTERLETEKVKKAYKSTNNAFEKLIVIDKENGGKADALNAGLNISNSKYILSVDGDSVLAGDALQKMIKPFLENKETVIASGGVIRIANDCTIKDGHLVDVNIPKNHLLRFQILEYLRSFLLARIGWSRCKGMNLVSGALGMLEREIAIAVNGYDKHSIGEDMDIIIKMQRLMYDRKEKFKIIYLPDPLCWTEAPEKYKTLEQQRKRWTRGTISSLWKNKDVLMRPKYGIMGMFAYPFWVIYERFGPLIEIAGIIFFICASFLGIVNWYYTISFLIATYLFAVMYSLAGLVSEDITYNQYKKKGDFFKLLLTILIEPFTYHIFLLWPALLGNISETIGAKKTWGKMERRGLELKEA